MYSDNFLTILSHKNELRQETVNKPAEAENF